MALTAVKLTWLTFILWDIHVLFSRPPILHCDNLSAFYLSVNLILHTRVKHIEIDFHYVYEQVVLSALKTRFVSFSSQLVDIFIKALSKLRFQKIQFKLNLYSYVQLRLKGMRRTNNKKLTLTSMFSFYIHSIFISFMSITLGYN